MGGGKGGGSSTTNVTQRPLSQQELNLLSTQEAALKEGMGIARDQNDLAKQNQADWNSTYRTMENTDLKNAVLNANADMGKVDQNAYALNKANMFGGLDSNYKRSLDDMDAAMARRGLSNSGASISAMKDIFSNRANAMAMAGNQAYNQGIATGDAYRQQKVANLTGYAQLGRGMAGMASNYLSGAAGTYGNAAQTSGSTANGIGGNNTSFMGSQMSANARDNETKGAFQGAVVGGAMRGAGAAFSDARLKENLERIGVTDRFILYRWDWNDIAKSIGADHYPTWGVIAQDVQETMPDAVIVRGDGYLMVDYSKVFGGSK